MSRVQHELHWTLTCLKFQHLSIIQLKINCHNPINKIQWFSQCIELKNSSVKELFLYTDSPKTHLTKLVQNIISSTFTCWKRKGHWRNKKWTPKHFYWIEYLFPQSRAYSNQYTLLPSNSIILPPTTPYFGFKSSPEDPWLVQLGHSKSEDCFLWAEPLRFSFFFLFSLCACMYGRETRRRYLYHISLCASKKNPMCRYYALLDLLVW